MSPDNFCYWLQGFAEINGSPPTDDQWLVIKDHLKLVFDKKTPEYPPMSKPMMPPPGTTVVPHVKPLIAECSVGPKTHVLGTGTNLLC